MRAQKWLTMYSRVSMAEEAKVGQTVPNFPSLCTQAWERLSIKVSRSLIRITIPFPAVLPCFNISKAPFIASRPPDIDSTSGGSSLCVSSSSYSHLLRWPPTYWLVWKSLIGTVWTWMLGEYVGGMPARATRWLSLLPPPRVATYADDNRFVGVSYPGRQYLELVRSARTCWHQAAVWDPTVSTANLSEPGISCLMSRLAWSRSLLSTRMSKSHVSHSFYNNPADKPTRSEWL